jgi:hypothetical protein
MWCRHAWLLFKFIRPVTETRGSPQPEFLIWLFIYYLGSNNLAVSETRIVNIYYVFQPNKIKLYEGFLWKTEKVPYFMGTNILQMILDL